MESEAETFYELWSDDPLIFPPHSRLYHVEPIGLGSPFVESLTSYITRLAEAHSVRLSTLISKEILPLWKLASVYQNDGLVYSHLTAFWKDTASLNGRASTAWSLVQALNQLTSRHDLHLLTMLPFGEILSPRNLIRRTRVWCPQCYGEWQASDHVIYEPLLWSLQCVCICSRHNCWLENRCPNPDCHRVQYPLASRSRSGYCAWCGWWLGSPISPNVPSLFLEDKEWVWMQWVEKQGGELLAANHSSPSRDTIARVLSRYLNEEIRGNKSELARRLHVTAQAVDGWVRGRQIPQLSTLMQICAHLEISLLPFLNQNPTVENPRETYSEQVKPTIEKTARKFRRMDITALQSALEKIIQDGEDPPLCMREVAQRLNYGASHLWKVFPDLCRAISARYLEYHSKKRVARLQALREEVRQIIYHLHAQGYYPSAWLVAKSLTTEGVFRNPVVLTTWQETLLELGLRQ